MCVLGGGGGGRIREVYMTGGPMEPHITSPKKYMSLKF